jgi:putative peptide zinc metalloprotease protein
VILAALAGFVALDVALITAGGLGQVVPSALALIYQPVLTLLVLLMILASAVFHECGHITACRYGGARPGKMGFGPVSGMAGPVQHGDRLLPAVPGGSVRTDLGGVCFNAVFIAGMNVAYLNTGHRGCWWPSCCCTSRLRCSSCR